MRQPIGGEGTLVVQESGGDLAEGLEKPLQKVLRQAAPIRDDVLFELGPPSSERPHGRTREPVWEDWSDASLSGMPHGDLVGAGAAAPAEDQLSWGDPAGGLGSLEGDWPGPGASGRSEGDWGGARGNVPRQRKGAFSERELEGPPGDFEGEDWRGKGWYKPRGETRGSLFDDAEGDELFAFEDGDDPFAFGDELAWGADQWGDPAGPGDSTGGAGPGSQAPRRSRKMASSEST